jgi:hypothetical protein
MNQNMYEIFRDFERAPDRAAKIAVLHKNNRPALLDLLQGALHPDVKFTVKSKPSYRRSDAPPGMGYSSIDVEIRRAYLFVEGSTRAPPNLTDIRRQEILIQILEALESAEADVFMNMILKDLKVKGLTYKLVQEAFPGLLP